MQYARGEEQQECQNRGPSELWKHMWDAHCYKLIHAGRHRDKFEWVECPLWDCNCRFEDFNEFRAHIKWVHFQREPALCAECLADGDTEVHLFYSDLRQLDRHRRRCHPMALQRQWQDYVWKHQEWAWVFDDELPPAGKERAEYEAQLDEPPVVQPKPMVPVTVTTTATTHGWHKKRVNGHGEQMVYGVVRVDVTETEEMEEVKLRLSNRAKRHRVHTCLPPKVRHTKVARRQYEAPARGRWDPYYFIPTEKGRYCIPEPFWETEAIVAKHEGRSHDVDVLLYRAKTLGEIGMINMHWHKSQRRKRARQSRVTFYRKIAQRQGTDIAKRKALDAQQERAEKYGKLREREPDGSCEGVPEQPPYTQAGCEAWELPPAPEDVQDEPPYLSSSSSSSSSTGQADDEAEEFDFYRYRRNVLSSSSEEPIQIHACWATPGECNCHSGDEDE